MTDKAAMRARMKQLRAAGADHPSRSAEMCRRLRDLDEVRAARTLMAFASVRGEPDLADLLADVHQRGVALALPRVEGDAIVPVPVMPSSMLTPGAFGVPEPPGDPIDLAVIDVVVVPGLAFTAQGWRLGHGGGHYDRLLAALSPTTVTVGVCFSEHLVDQLPRESHDRPVDVVVTELATYRPGGPARRAAQTSS